MKLVKQKTKHSICAAVNLINRTLSQNDINFDTKILFDSTKCITFLYNL